MDNRISSLLRRLCFWLIIISLPLNVCAQSKERPKIKDFGSSLKRTKWDPNKQQATVTKPTQTSNSKEDELDVVKVETSLVSSDVLVLDAQGKPVDGLTENDFLISDSLILSDINRRYLVGYYPTNKEHDGKRRKLEMSVRKHSDYKVVGRKWYYAPSADQ